MANIPQDRIEELAWFTPPKESKLRLPQSWNGSDDNQPVLTDAKGTPDGIGGGTDYYSAKVRARG